MLDFEYVPEAIFESNFSCVFMKKVLNEPWKATRWDPHTFFRRKSTLPFIQIKNHVSTPVTIDLIPSVNVQYYTIVCVKYESIS